MGGLEREEVDFRGRIINLKNEIDDYNKRKETINKIKNLGEEFGRKFKDLDRQKKKVILRSLVEEITLEADKNKKGLRNDNRQKKVQEIKEIKILFKV